MYFIEISSAGPRLKAGWPAPLWLTDVNGLDVGPAGRAASTLSGRRRGGPLDFTCNGRTATGVPDVTLQLQLYRRGHFFPRRLN